MKSKNKFNKCLYIKKINNDLCCIKYKIAHLKKAKFTYKPNEGYCFKDTYIYGSYKVIFKMNIKNNNFDTVFQSEYGLFHVTKHKDGFDIVITSEPFSINKLNKKIIYTIKGNIEPIIYSCIIEGIIPYDPLKKKGKKHKSHKKYASQKTMYNSSKWAVQHPYYGGSFTPR